MVVGGQAQSDSIAYSRDYEFKEGVFLNFDQFKNNAPILKSAIVSAVPKSQIDFISEVLDQKNLVYKDSAGNEQKIETANIWGYCQNRTIAVNFNKGFNRINVIGTFSLFSALVIKTPIDRDPMGNVYNMNTSYEELHQFVLDTKTNKVLDFNVKNMELLLKNDPVLYEQFMKLKKRAKADSIFIYLRKFNEKHPLYLPVK
jgi:hypothetical protein